MIYNITVTNPQGEELVLDLDRPRESGLVVVNGEGLGPPKATINTSELAGIDGSQYNSAVLDPRNIVLTLAYLENPTIEATRHLLYRFFPTKRRVKLTFETDTRKSSIYGYVESNEALIFSQQTGSTISILCPNPLFTDENPLELNFYNRIPRFEFPFSDPVGSSDLIFSDLEVRQTIEFDYEGGYQSGYLIEVNALAAATNLIVRDELTGEKMEFNDTELIAATGSGIVAGDLIRISSVRGDKFVRLIRGSTNHNIIRALKPGYSWLQLRPGTNLISYLASTGASQLRVSLRGSAYYEGI